MTFVQYVITTGLIWLSGFLLGIHCGNKGILVDSRLDKLQQKEAGLISELKSLLAITEGYGYMMALQKMGRKPGDVARELAQTRLTIIQLGGQPQILRPDLMEVLCQSDKNQEKG